VNIRLGIAIATSALCSVASALSLVLAGIGDQGSGMRDPG
jgi:hypothetical protein